MVANFPFILKLPMMHFIPIYGYNIQIMHLHNFEFHAQCFIYMLLLKYFIIIKKEEIVAPWIDFDDYKAFEGVTNDFCLKKTYCISGVKS